MNQPKTPVVPPILKKARWIWPDSHHWDLHNAYALFRKEFRLEKVPTNAPLYITADESYQLYVNGIYVCRGPARGFQKTWPYDTVDVSAWLKKGKNLIAVRAHNPGFSNFQYISQGYAGLLVAGRWGKTEVLSGAGWKCRRQCGVRRDTVPTSLQLFCQESIDLNVEEPDWMMPRFDDSSWGDQPPSVAWNAMPWYALESRGIPMMDEHEVPLGRIIGTSQGKSQAGYASTRNLALNRYEEGLAHQATEDDSRVIHFLRTPKGKWSSRLIDLGKLNVGSVLLDIKEALGGEIVECHHYETLEQDALTPDYLPEAHCRMAFSQRLVCRPGHNRHAFYHTFGFRYMVLTVRDNRAPLVVGSSLRTTLYPMEEKGRFDSSDETLNAIWKTCSWTQRVCSLDAYVDTPWREQAQWWGDARVQSWNTFHLCGDARLLRRGIRQIASQATPDGVTYGHAPTMAHGCVLPDFTLIWMLTLWDYYWQTGSLEAFIEHQPTLLKALEYFSEWTDDKTGLLRYDHRFWLFLDWTDVRKEGFSSIYSLWYLHALDRMVTLYGLAEDLPRATMLKKRAAILRKHLRELVGQDGLMRDGYAEAGRLDPHCSVHTETLALMTGLAPRHKKMMLEKQILQEVIGQNHSKARPSAYWITYVYDVLSEHGFAREVVEDIRTRWSPMVEQGTTWENFQPVRAVESFSHAWSAHPLFHLMRILGGLRQTAPGWQEVTCAPNFIGDHADVTIPTPLGLIHSKWQRQGERISGQLEVPKGIRACLCLPGMADKDVTGKYRYTIVNESIS